MNVVISGSKLEYLKFLQQKGVNKKDYHYVEREENMIGIESKDLVIYLVGTWWNNKLHFCDAVHLHKQGGAKIAYATT